MRGSKAKKLRKEAYGKGDKTPAYFKSRKSGMYVRDEPRRKYQHLKKEGYASN